MCVTRQNVGAVSEMWLVLNCTLQNIRRGERVWERHQTRFKIPRPLQNSPILWPFSLRQLWGKTNKRWCQLCVLDIEQCFPKILSQDPLLCSPCGRMVTLRLRTSNNVPELTQPEASGRHCAFRGIFLVYFFIKKLRHFKAFNSFFYIKKGQVQGRSKVFLD